MTYFAVLVALLVSALAGPVAAQEHDEDDEQGAGRFGFGGHAVLNYFHFDWDTDTSRRDVVDLERFVLESHYKVSDRLLFEGEVEFEHGGTGVTMEFDRLEEFGEFEQEVEKGGEIVVEKLQATFHLRRAFNVRVGHLYVPVGLLTAYDEPEDYFTNTYSEAEAAMIPTIWHESGVGFLGQMGRFHYQGYVVTGLDGTGFSSATWVRRGHQARFEMVNAEDLALTGRLDVDIAAGCRVGASAYYGNSTGNRPKPDLTVPAYVTIFDGHATAAVGRFRVRGLVLYGELQNADLVSAANRNLSNNLNVKRTPVGSAALAWYLEGGANVLGPRTPLYVFGRYDWYDTMYRVTGDIFDNPRWARTVVTTGLNWFPDPHFIVKASYSRRTIGLPSNNLEETVALGVAAQF